MSHEEFENLVIEALEGVPEFFKEKLDNVDLVIEDWPATYQGRGFLLGLYQGIPQPARSRGYSLALPDKITIFQGPIEIVAAGDPEKIKEVVVDTVQHEIAHHFGISDTRLKELGG
jgi:predicted Zn-dependent protease with MMP-like domain